jgi:uncharacterized protein DUF5656
MAENRQLPDANRLSVLIATILLAYALGRTIALPPYTLLTSIFGRAVGIQIDASVLVPFLTAGLTATGMDWLLQNHPAIQGRSRSEHWILPALTAWVAGLFLYSLSTSSAWWAAFVLAGVLLIMVIYAEYITVKAADSRYGLASALLVSLAFALFLLVAVALRTIGARLFVSLPILFVSAWLATLRTLHLRLGGRWELGWATGIALATAQFAAAMHYWPLTPLRYGLVVLAPAYALATLAVNLREEMPPRRAVGGPLAAMLLVWALALVFA